MSSTLPAATVALLCALCTASGAVQAPERRNPFENNAKAIEQGRQLYALSCASCHGLSGRGVRGPDLTTGQFTRGTTDEQLLRIVMQGIPGTDMPPLRDADDDDVWMVLAYIRSLGQTAPGEAPRGNARSGETIFWGKGNCGQCHMVHGRGGRLGPDLSRIGASRSPAALAQEIRTPSQFLSTQYDAVMVTTATGERIRGAVKNEDPFSIQLMDLDERIRSFLKSELKDATREKESLMPAYGPKQLTDPELDDLIRYLGELRGPVVTSSN